jgi:4-hydroxythreonine-4-phosphate dehydrogenase
MGEPAGIGPDLILKLFVERGANALPPFLLYGHVDFLRIRAARLGLHVAIEPATPLTANGVFGYALPVSDIAGLVPDKPGDSSPLSANVVIEAIAQAVAETITGRCRGLITAPIHKQALYTAGFKYPGHTEYLAALCSGSGPPRVPVMMLTHENFRVVPLTIHVPLSAVPKLVTQDLIQQTVRTVSHDLRTRFGIEDPKIGVAGLNPHAGEGGAIGLEDFDTVAPAVGQLVHEGFNVTGPIPADTLFHPPHWAEYDVVIAMYHDQALIPIKTMAFEEAVNVTLGLPIVRTSPDHGTAFDLAGTGKGSDKSFLAAIRLADRLTGHRA